MVDYTTRAAIYEQIEKTRGSKVLAYITGDKPGMEAQIARDAINVIVDHLDLMWPTKKLSLIIHTNGGDTAAAWQIVNLLRTFSDELEVIIPAKALSSGTIISLGANTIVMTKQASLGPIDPSLNSPLGPMMPQFGGATFPVSVEAVQGYLDVVTEQLKVTDATALASVWNALSEKIHPLVLGQIYRTRSQIRTLARKLLVHQELDEQRVNEIIAFLCSDSGSHDHTINRREAHTMGLKIEKASDELYGMLRDVQSSFTQEMSLRQPFRPDILVSDKRRTAGSGVAYPIEVDYCVPRVLIESIAAGSSQYVTQGTLVAHQAMQIDDVRYFEGWRQA